MYSADVLSICSGTLPKLLRKPSSDIMLEQNTASSFIVRAAATSSDFIVDCAVSPCSPTLKMVGASVSVTIYDSVNLSWPPCRTQSDSPTRLETLHQSRVVVVVDVVVVQRVRVGVEIWFSQLVKRTRLEIFRQSRVVVIVDIVVVRRVRVCEKTSRCSLCRVLGWKHSARAAWLLLLMMSSSSLLFLLGSTPL